MYSQFEKHFQNPSAQLTSACLTFWADLAAWKICIDIDQKPDMLQYEREREREPLFEQCLAEFCEVILTVLQILVKLESSNSPSFVASSIDSFYAIFEH